MIYIKLMDTLSLPEWLNRKFLEWQMENGRATAEDFAENLGIKPAIFSHYMNGRRTPRGENLYKLAEKLGYEIYDILGYPRPSSSSRILRELWEKLPESEKIDVLNVIEDYLRIKGIK